MLTGEYFQHLFCIIMGANVASFLLKDKTKHDPKLTLLFFSEYGFDTTKRSKLEVEYWISTFLSEILRYIGC